MASEALKPGDRKAKDSPFSSGLLAAGVLLVAILLFMIIKPVKVLPVLVDAPTYSLVNQYGDPVSSDELRGQVVLYNFVYTHCTTVCPAMTGQMRQVQDALALDGTLGQDVVLVTITFDPERDTPERLLSYAGQVGAESSAWLWLTGEEVSIKRLVGGEFGVYFEQVPLDEAAAQAAGLTDEERAAGYDFIHSTLFVLVDEQGQVRAEYQQMLDIDQALRDITWVVREKNAGQLLRPIWRLSHLLRAYP